MNILVLDDDVAVGRSLQRVLQTNGHVVTLCTQGEEALSLLAKEDFEVIFSDIMMPVMSGRDFYMELQKHHPKMVDCLIFITGSIFDPKLAQWFETQPCPILMKPMTKADLLQAIQLVGVSNQRECQTFSEMGRW